MTGVWLRGLLARRWGRLMATAGGIALAVAMLASLGSFLAASKASMTRRAARTPAVDWQVEVQPGGDPAAVLAATRRAAPVREALPVSFAQVSGFAATTQGTTQTTGSGVVLGLPPRYRAAFPREVRTLSGADTGVLVAQQTAANLHVGPGDKVVIQEPALAPQTVVVAGVVDLPQADSLFQKVGAPPQSQPQAPPDNVLLLPQPLFDKVMRPVAARRPDLLTHQVHARLSHGLAGDPSVAYNQVTAAGRHLEAATAGAALVGSNLGAVLDSARQDALYAQILFLFLGVPGAALAGLLTAAVAGSGATRRRREQALLRVRGAAPGPVLRAAGIEALVVGLLGALLGLGAAALVGGAMFGSFGFGATSRAAVAWGTAAFLVGMLVAVGTVLLPARRDLRSTTAHDALAPVRRRGAPRWFRYGLDFLLLGAALLVLWLSGRNGYQLVLAPEGVPTVSVSYWALLAPALLWVACGLLAWRLVHLVLEHGRSAVRGVVRPVAGHLAGTLASGLARRRREVASAAVLIGLAVSFAASTATFDATFRQQAEVDARLTTGADVTVTEPPGAAVPAGAAARIAAVPGVKRVEPMLHRFAYVGSDLQDMYGVRPATVGAATSLQDSYFQGGTTTQLMHRLAVRPDSVLVSAETVKDFQLSPGDLLKLRIQDARTHRLVTVPFHYAGVVNEFPTAPTDSFFVANADYVARRTGSAAVGTFLVDTGGRDTRAVAARIRAQVGTSAKVDDISAARSVVGSSLTSVDLAGLTKVELSFSLVLVAAASGLLLALGLAERRRTFAITAALGATRRQLAALVWGEAAVLTVAGLFAGAVSGWALARTLVAILRNVFDPPPAHLSVPWSYLAVVGGSAVLAMVVAATLAARTSRRPAVEVLREL